MPHLDSATRRCTCIWRGDLTRARQHLDEDEFLDVVTMPFDTLVEQVMSGEITDAKTVATVLKVKTLLGR